jgi:hypothetical protein
VSEPVGIRQGNLRRQSINSKIGDTRKMTMAELVDARPCSYGWQSVADVVKERGEFARNANQVHVSLRRECRSECERVTATDALGQLCIDRVCACAHCFARALHPRQWTNRHAPRGGCQQAHAHVRSCAHMYLTSSLCCGHLSLDWWWFQR